jgi:hypothetical protein
MMKQFRPYRFPPLSQFPAAAPHSNGNGVDGKQWQVGCRDPQFPQRCGQAAETGE